jgi:hypothetical protein
MSSEENYYEPCPGCKAQILYESMYKCYECGYVGCADCGFNEDGECGVCCSEEKAWDKYTEGINKLENIKKSIDRLIIHMKEWKEKVEELEDDIECHSSGEKLDGSEIMTDCGESVIVELNWYLEEVKNIVNGKE